MNQSDSALLAVGYGFADDHINRVVLQAFANPSFQLMVVSPSGVVSSTPSGKEAEPPALEFLDTGLGRLARIRDPRITVVTGSEAGTFADLAENGFPTAAEPEEEGRVERTAELLTEALMEGEGDVQ